MNEKSETVKKVRRNRKWKGSLTDGGFGIAEQLLLLVDGAFGREIRTRFASF